MNNREIGNKGEEVASKYLEKLGYEIIERNFRSRFGEIDIIASDNNAYVFIEVKSRRTTKLGYPCEAVTYYKQCRIKKTAIYYVKRKHIFNADIRFDIVEILGNKIRVIKNAF